MFNKNQERSADRSEDLAALKKVADVIEERKEWVLDRWLERVKLASELTTMRLSEAERKDHVPDLLEEAIAHSRGNPIHQEERQKAAERHGALRYHQGYSIPMLVLEQYLLQDVIAECIRDNFSVIDLSDLMLGMAKVSATLAAELEESRSSYMQQSEWHRNRTINGYHKSY